MTPVPGKIMNLQTIRIGEWVIRCREPGGNGPHPAIWLFHGWMGDEDSMWIFASRLPDHFLILAPRGPHPQENGGYGWYPDKKGWPTLEDFTPAIRDLLALMDRWPLTAPWGDFERFRVAGFSQGAALAYAFALLHPTRIEAVAGLAGFLPLGAENPPGSRNLAGLTVYVSHGAQDPIVPVHLARQAAQFFDDVGAEVTFCESQVGHKLSADCFEGLEVFFRGERPA